LAFKQKNEVRSLRRKVFAGFVSIQETDETFVPFRGHLRQIRLRQINSPFLKVRGCFSEGEQGMKITLLRQW
jgi:hypothetical protein